MLTSELGENKRNDNCRILRTTIVIIQNAEILRNISDLRKMKMQKKKSEFFFLFFKISNSAKLIASLNRAEEVRKVCYSL